MQSGVCLAPFERHPIEAIIRKKREPFVEAVFVEQARLVRDKGDQVGIGRGSHGAPHIDNVMNFDQARN